MQNYNIKDYSVEFDRTATVDWYENMKVGAVIVVTAKVFSMGQAETASIRSNRITPNFWSVAGKTDLCM